ncbi:Coatomer beta subunit [Sesbania bispinosa]|nr:Coatomer beta subunit [Sesbania bispinosa]
MSEEEKLLKEAKKLPWEDRLFHKNWKEKALDALIAYLRAADADAGRYGKEVCDAVVAKCLTGRPKTVEKAQAAFMLWGGIGGRGCISAVCLVILYVVD